MTTAVFRRIASVEEWLLLAALVSIDVAARLLPHAANATPLAASALFAGVVFRNRALAVIAPLAAMFAGDLILGFYDWRVMAVVYAGLTLPAILGICGRAFRLPLILLPLVLASSLVFFAATNFAVWAFSGMYAHTGDGLIACYVAALPFLRNGLAADAIWAIALFGGWWLMHRYQRLVTPAIPRSATARARAS